MSTLSATASSKRATAKELNSSIPLKKKRMMSSLISDSDCSSSMSPLLSSGNDSSSNISKKRTNKTYHQLVLLTKPDEIIMNGRNRRRFPDPAHDRSILFACFDADGSMVKICHGKRKGNVNNESNMSESILKRRINMEPIKGEFCVSDESCSYFLCLDVIQSFDCDGLKKDVDEKIMMADIRDHSVAGKCLPDGVTGYWVRFFGPKRKFVFYFSVWKLLAQNFKEVSGKCKSSVSDKLIKISEKCVTVWNSGREKSLKKRKLKKKKKKVLGIAKALKDNELHGSDHVPSFCSKEKYFQILVSLRDSIENAQYELFEELYEKFSTELCDDERDNIELKLFLWCEKSQLFAVQGKYTEAKKWLQNVVENVVPKSPNKKFMLNRAYLLLANTHVLEGNNGTAEECLSIIQPDKKNGMPYEDLGMFDLLRGIILMNFGKQLPRLSKFLWCESKESFEVCAVNFKKALPLMFNQYCRMHLNLGRLLLYQCSIVEHPSDLDAPREQVCTVERYGVKSLSLHIQCLLAIVKSELFYHLKQPDKGSSFLDQAQEMAVKYNFHEESMISDQIRQSWNEAQYQQFIDSLESDKLTEAVRNCVMSDIYSADESST